MTGFAAPLALTLPTPETTAALAAWLAPRLRAGDVLLLSGPVGAGKTHFARALIQTLLAAQGAVEDVPSPSFTLVQTYDAGALEVWHVDLYRLSDPSEVWELGLDAALDAALCLIEWPERLGADRPEGALRLDFAPAAQAEARRLTLHGPAARWGGLLAEMGAAFAPDGGHTSA
ncbi:MAG: tRNA (adenosine(37)-N6)-threonylcarbamoyltransferase complex ATPase subunit type 1 TsaE [Rhodobacteraceae bacterium]|nr:tRNA (adenosine(37)-N6)-threonylcarbamoyltransferase complex ATPase subunit type 1 TsaE [Paracoccaceae bacterium]